MPPAPSRRPPGQRPDSSLDLGLEPTPQPPSSRQAARPAEPIGGDAGDGDTELDLRLPDGTIPPISARKPPPSALVDRDAPPLELARPVGRPPVVGGTRELELDIQPGGRGPELGATAPRRSPRTAPPPRRSRAIRSPWPRRLLIVLLALGVVIGAVALYLAYRGLTVETARAELTRWAASVDAPRLLIDTAGPETMVLIPGGESPGGCVGADGACAPDEQAEIRSMSSILVDRTEVTRAHYAECVERRACTPPGTSDPGCAAPADHPTWPVSCVSLQQAQAYCRSVSKRLPTAAEWEHAARAGEPRVYPWGPEPASCALANLEGCRKSPAPVGTYLAGANPLGLQDLAGNVREWTTDGTPAQHEVRGGSFQDGPRGARISHRARVPAATQAPDLGFRCVR